MESHSEMKGSRVCPAAAEKLRGLMDGDQEAESGGLATDCHSGGKSLSDLGKLSQPGHSETRALGLMLLTACPPTITWEAPSTGMGSLLVQGQGRRGLGPKENGNPALLLISLSSTRMTGRACGDRMALVPFPAH